MWKMTINKNVLEYVIELISINQKFTVVDGGGGGWVVLWILG